MREYANVFEYFVEFSKPHKTKPIPEGTVRVYFNIIMKEDGQYDIEFNFENESLKHNLDYNTMRKNMFEVSMHELISGEDKHILRSILHYEKDFSPLLVFYSYFDSTGTQMLILLFKSFTNQFYMLLVMDWPCSREQA